MKKLLVFFLLFFTASAIFSQDASSSVQIFMAADGSDQNEGSLQKPFLTFRRVMHAVREAKRSNIKNIEVCIRGGDYYITSPLRLIEDDGGSKDISVTYKAFKNEVVNIRGGILLNSWEYAGDGTWICKLQQEKVLSGENYFRQLFRVHTNDSLFRLTRSYIKPDNYTGFSISRSALREFKERIKTGDFQAAEKLKIDNPEAFCGFGYAGSDFTFWPDWKNAEVLMHHSWESSWQTIRNIDTSLKEVYFNTPSVWPVGFFSEHHRYRVENIRAGLTRPGEWLMDGHTSRLVYLPKPGDDLSTFSCFAPVLDKLLLIEGINRQVENLHFEAIRFEGSSYELGTYVQAVHQTDSAYPFRSLEFDWDTLIRKTRPDWPAGYKPGYSDPQAALHCGSAIFLTNVRNCSFKQCSFSQSGAYAIRIGDRCSEITILRNNFFDLGGGAIMVGEGIADPAFVHYPLPYAPGFIHISHNRIYNTGRVFSGSAGIFLGQTHDTKVTYNELYSMPYSGISIGWTWGNGENYLFRDSISNNHIHHVLQVLDDGGGIYTLGRMKDCYIGWNHIHDIKRSPGTTGSKNTGIFFDEGTAEVAVEKNVIHTCRDGAIRFNRAGKVRMYKNTFRRGRLLFPHKINSITGVGAGR